MAQQSSIRLFDRGLKEELLSFLNSNYFIVHKEDITKEDNILTVPISINDSFIQQQEDRKEALTVLSNMIITEYPAILQFDYHLDNIGDFTVKNNFK